MQKRETEAALNNSKIELQGLDAPSRPNSAFYFSLYLSRRIPSRSRTSFQGRRGQDTKTVTNDKIYRLDTNRKQPKAETDER